MSTFFAFGILLLLCFYVSLECGWGGSNSDWRNNPPSRRPAFPWWRPWRPSGSKRRDPDPAPKPKPRVPELVDR